MHPSAVRPRLSAGAILWRRRDRGCEVFWVKRSDSLRFMGGWHAFPGGKLARGDEAVPCRGRIDGETAYERSGETVAHVACALRELFEEAGVLVARGTLPEAADLARARERLLADDLDFAAWIESCGLELDASRLSFAGRWVTPPLSPIRFDATFFLVEWPESERQQPVVVPGELSAGQWILAGSALRHWEAGEALLAQPTLQTLRVLAEHGPEGRDRLWRSEAHKPNSPRVIEFRPSVRVIPLETRTLPPATHTNAILLGSQAMVLIDPGASGEDELSGLREVVDTELRRTGGKLDAIWLSHHHGDHVAGVETLRRHYQVPVLAHPLTRARLGDAGIRVDACFEGGESVTLNGDPPMQIRVLHTPGHASGHLCFLEERNRTLLCGDMLSGYGTVSINPPDGNMADYVRSLERLEALDPAVILPGHGSMIPRGAQALAKAREHRLWREDRVLEAWDAGERDPEAMLSTVYGELDPTLRPFAVRQVLAHLERLESIGRVTGLPDAIRAALR